MLKSGRLAAFIAVAILLVAGLTFDIYHRDSSWSRLPQAWRQAAYSQRTQRVILDAFVLEHSLPEKGVVTAKLASQDTTWLHNLTEYQNPDPSWHQYIYVADNDTAPLHPPLNKGSESLSYLTFLIDFYDALPHTIAFIHYHQKAWHNDDPFDTNDNAAALRALRTDTVQREGYVNMRCVTAHACPDMIRTDRNPADDDYDAPEHLVEKFVPDAWEQLQVLGRGAPLPKTIATACCAQFAVSREQVRARSKKYYQNIRRWIIETEDNDWVSGRVMEYMWHMMFGREAVHCSAEEQCFCNVYGRC